MTLQTIFLHHTALGEGDISVPCPIADLSPFQDTLASAPLGTSLKGSGINDPGSSQVAFDNDALMGLLSQGVNVLVNQVGDNLGQGVNVLVSQVYFSKFLMILFLFSTIFLCILYVFQFYCYMFKTFFIHSLIRSSIYCFTGLFIC